MAGTDHIVGYFRIPSDGQILDCKLSNGQIAFQVLYITHIGNMANYDYITISFPVWIHSFKQLREIISYRRLVSQWIRGGGCFQVRPIIVQLLSNMLYKIMNYLNNIGPLMC